MSQNILSLSDLLQETISATIGRIDGALPARIVSYDRVTQSATIEIDSFKLVKSDIEGEVESMRYPKLHNIPVAWLSAGGFSITSDLVAGDRGFILPCERSIDGWKSTGRATEEVFRRRFDHSDSIFFPVARPPSDPLPNDRWAADTTVVKSPNMLMDCEGTTTIRSAGDTVILSDSLIRIGDVAATSPAVRGSGLKTILNTLTSALDNHAAALTASVTLANGIATGAALTSSVATLKTINALEAYLQEDVKIK